VIELVAFDGDDTLWHSEIEFAVTQERVRDLLAPHCDAATLDGRLLEVERRNLELYGYGAKAFTLSVLETAIELVGDRLTADDVRGILTIGKDLLAHPVEMLEGAADAVAWAAERWPTIIITKGDLFHQESKVARSGLGDALRGVDVVAEKEPSAYARVCARHGCSPAHLVMVGNSLRSDIEPVLSLGGWGVHVPYPLTWDLDRADDEDALRTNDRFRSVTTLTELPALLTSFC
jgi:putative hydrolase of the HAD superfamily